MRSCTQLTLPSSPFPKVGYGAAIPAQGQQRHRKLEKLRSRADIQLLSNDECELKTNMFYHISNPIARWKADHSPPVKMVLQLLQTVCVITQVSVCVWTCDVRVVCDVCVCVCVLFGCALCGWVSIGINFV